MHRTTADPTRRPAWVYDKHDRLSALARRARELAEALRRERCDHVADKVIADRLAARMATNEARFHLLARCARESRREAKGLATS